MPYDDITKMRAELLERYGPNERPEEFDDGASLLGQNPYMQEVGFFGKQPKFNPSRRTMGLDLPSVKNPVPTAIEDPTTAVVPVQPQQPKTISPLEALASMPMTRRKALEIPMNAAISNVGRGLIGEAVAPVVKSVANEIVPKAVESTFVRNPLFDEYLQNYVNGIFTNANENGLPEVAFSSYQLIRDYLTGNVPEKVLKKYDKIYDKAAQYMEPLEDDFAETYDDRVYDLTDKLENFVSENLKYLKPNEMQNLIEDLTQSDELPKDFAKEVVRSMDENWGIEDAKSNSEGFIKYLEDAWSQK